MSNLCRNALQAIEQQDIANGTIRVGAGGGGRGGGGARNGRRVTIEIADDGPGVPQKARAHLFQAFQGSARAGGTGLGLAVATNP